MMPARYFVSMAVLISFALPVQASVTPQTVEIHSGDLRLKAFLWMPPGAGPFPAVLFNHGRSDSAQSHWRAGGEGPSADQGDFIGDLLEREENTKGAAAKNRLQSRLLSKDHLADSLAALALLKALPQVDVHRIAVVGHSFGGQITLLEAAREPNVRAAVTFGAAAGSWGGSEELRTTLLEAVDRITVPVLLIHTANDYSVTPGRRWQTNWPVCPSRTF